MVEYEALIAASEPMPDAMAAPDDLPAIFYTGGTTGRSKGVMLSHRNITANAFNVLAEGLVPETAAARLCSALPARRSWGHPAANASVCSR
jgi:long-chain acyl-CoA synthetase